MFVSAEQIHKGLHSYIDKELVAKAGQGKKFLILLVEPLIKGTVNNYIETYSNAPLTKELFDENKNVNLDMLYDMAKNAMSKSGSITMYGIVFDGTDVTKLYSYIKGEML